MEERTEFEVMENEGTTTEYSITENEEPKNSHTGLKVLGAGAVIGTIAALIYRHHKKKVTAAEKELFDDDAEVITVEPENQKPADQKKPEEKKPEKK